jgi:hypothetical protein
MEFWGDSPQEVCRPQTCPPVQVVLGVQVGSLGTQLFPSAAVSEGRGRKWQHLQGDCGLGRDIGDAELHLPSGKDTWAHAADSMVRLSKAQIVKAPTALLVRGTEAARNLAATTVGLCNKGDMDSSKGREGRVREQRRPTAFTTPANEAASQAIAYTWKAQHG